MKYPEKFLELASLLKKLPGVGNRTSERYAFEMLKWQQKDLDALAEIVKNLKDTLTTCQECGCFLVNNRCPFCNAIVEREKKLCITGSIKDVYAIELTQEFKGYYHVLDGLISPMHGIGPEILCIDAIINRIKKYDIKELVIALDATLEGDTTALYIKDELDSISIPISRLAFGVPMGSSLDYVDGSTLARALSGRNNF